MMSDTPRIDTAIHERDVYTWNDVPHRGFELMKEARGYLNIFYNFSRNKT